MLTVVFRHTSQYGLQIRRRELSVAPGLSPRQLHLQIDIKTAPSCPSPSLLHMDADKFLKCHHQDSHMKLQETDDIWFYCDQESL